MQLKDTELEIDYCFENGKIRVFLETPPDWPFEIHREFIFLNIGEKIRVCGIDATDSYIWGSSRECADCAELRTFLSQVQARYALLMSLAVSKKAEYEERQRAKALAVAEMSKEILKWIV